MPLLEVTIPAGRCILTSKLSTHRASGSSRGWATGVTTPIVAEGGP